MKCETKIVARYAETDQMGVIHHSVYPVWFEAARTEYIKMAGMTYTQLERSGVMMPLTELSCKYIMPVHYEDEVTIITETLKLSFSRVTFRYKVLLNGSLMAEGSTTHAFVSTESFRPVSLKKVMPDLFEKLRSSCIAE